MNQFSKALSDELGKRSLSVYELAKIVDLDSAFLFRLTTGLKNPSYRTVLMLADAISLTPDQRLMREVGMDVEVDRKDPEWIRIAWKLNYAAMLDGGAKSKQSRR